MAVGIPSRGRLERVAGEIGLRGALDVGRAGTILVVDGRIDSEAIIRARATGVRGVVASGLAGKDLRDLQGSEARQRASLQPLAPFAVLVLDGTVRRPIAGPVAALLEALEGREVALVVDPPMIVFDPPVPEPAPPPADWVRVLARRARRAARVAGSGRRGCAGSPPASISRPGRSPSTTARSRWSRSPTSSASSDGRRRPSPLRSCHAPQVVRPGRAVRPTGGS